MRRSARGFVEGVRCVAVGICGISVSSSRGGRSSGRRTVSTRKLSGRGTSKENAYVRNRRGWWPRSRLRAWRRSAGACGARTAAPPDGEIKLASEIIHGDTNSMGRHMPAFSHAVGQILLRRRRRPDAMPNEPDQAAAISRATQCRRGGFYQTRFNFHSGGGDALFHAVSAWGVLPDAPDALSYPRPRAVPSRTRVRLGVSPQTTEPTRVTCATLRRVSRAR